MNTASTSGRNYAARFLLAFAAAFVLVAAASIAVGGRGQDAEGLVAGTIAILVFAIPSAAISAYLLRLDIGLVLVAQALTVLGMAALQFWA
jgi:hypothetical protein